MLKDVIYNRQINYFIVTLLYTQPHYPTKFIGQHSRLVYHFLALQQLLLSHSLSPKHHALY